MKIQVTKETFRKNIDQSSSKKEIPKQWTNSKTWGTSYPMTTTLKTPPNIEYKFGWTHVERYTLSADI